MVNILLEGYDIDAPWLKKALSGYILPDMKVAVAALSFRKNRVRSANDWDELYAPGGKFYNGIIAGFKSYGIPAEKVSFIDHFRDTKKSAVEKIGKADILYFLGGMPDLMYERIEGLGLGESMRNFKGIVIVSNSLLLDFSTELWYNDRTNQKVRYHHGNTRNNPRTAREERNVAGRACRKALCNPSGGQSMGDRKDDAGY